MDPSSKIKTHIHDYIFEVLTSKINDAKFAIAAAKESRNSDTKSSAGDKYETGRAMMQQEIEKNEMQLNSAMNQLQELSRIDLNKKNLKIDIGTIVLTDSGKFFISIGLGKIQLNGEIFYAVSLASPVGSVLKDKKAGDKISFQGNEIAIEKVF